MRLSPVAVIALAIALAACSPSDAPSRPANDVDQAAVDEGAPKPATPQEAVDPSSRTLAQKLEATGFFPPNVPIAEGESVIPGFKEVIIGGEIHYLDEGNTYLIRGEALNLNTGDNITNLARQKIHADIIKNELLPEDAIVFGSPKAKHHLIVFTDVECGYCRKFHEEIEQFLALDVRVSYYPWPRSGTQGPVYDEMVSVWCAKDQKKALTDAKAGRGVKAATCEGGEVDRYFEIGQRMGIRGTPAIFLEDGRQLGGYLAPEQMGTILNQPTTN